MTRQITAEPEGLQAPRPELTRQVTPEPVLDSMHARLPESKPADGLGGLEVKELPISSMHERVDSAHA